MNRSRLAQMLLGLLIVLPFLLHTVGQPRIGGLERLEQLAYDTRLNLTLPGGTDERIVIVDIDERSLAEIGRWPWSRDRVALLVDRLMEDYEVDTLGFDVVFAERDSGSAIEELERLAEGPLADETGFVESLEALRAELDHELRFANALSDRKVVLGYFFRRSINEGEPAGSGGLPAPADVADPNMLARLALPRARGYGANLPELQTAAASAGFFDNPLVDSDGVFRRVPLLQVYEEQAYTMFSLEVARAALGWPDLFLEIEQDAGSGYLALEALHMGEYRIPVDRRSGALVPYRGPQGSFPYVSAADVLHGTADPDLLRDRIVLVGTTAAGLLDLRTTPVQNVYPGVEIHANMIAGILDGAIRHEPAWVAGYEFVLVAVGGLLITLVAPFLTPLALSALLVAFAVALAGGTLMVWSLYGLSLPMATAGALLLALYITHVAWGYFIENRGKRRLTRIFSQYVPPELVREMDRSNEQITLAGESREMTVLFSDIRGFTGLSENLSPEALTALMNDYLTAMTDVIHQQRGTIDKYIGDAIMAFWGAPLRDPQHARHALAAALAMESALPAVNQRFEAAGWPKIDIGVGLNTGTMNVGNMGSEFRMSYTVLGDAVNLGSRLEGLTRTYGVRILVSDATAAENPDIRFREVDRVRVKGRNEPVTVLEPLGRMDAIAAEQERMLRIHESALAAYRNREWDKARKFWETLAQHDPNVPLAALYLDRIAHFEQAPPPPGWDGVYTHETK